jgi:hypothetical protein
MTENKNWLKHFARFELRLLQELGYGLEDAQKRLLPEFLSQEVEPSKAELLEGLEQTGKFLLDRVYASQGLRLPLAREKLVQKIRAQ